MISTGSKFQGIAFLLAAFSALTLLFAIIISSVRVLPVDAYHLLHSSLLVLLLISVPYLNASETTPEKAVIAPQSFAEVIRQTPLENAVRRQDAERVRQLLVRGTKATTVGAHQRTPLHYAARLGNQLIVELLLQYGANPIATDDQGKTPLYRSVQSGKLEIVRQLLEAEKNLKDRMVISKPMKNFAHELGFIEIEKLLAEFED